MVYKCNVDNRNERQKLHLSFNARSIFFLLIQL